MEKNLYKYKNFNNNLSTNSLISFNSKNTKNSKNAELEIRKTSFNINYYRQNANELGREINDFLLYDKSKPENKNFLGLTYMFLSVLLLSISHLISKIMFIYFPRVENSSSFFIRGVVIMLIAFYWIDQKQIFQHQKKANRKQLIQLIFRCLFGALCNITLVESFKFMRISSSYTLFCTYPIFVSILSIIYHNAKLTVFNVISYVACLISVIFISKPSFFFEANDEIKDTGYGIFLAVLSSIVNGIGVFLNKSIAKDFHYLVSLFLIGFWFIAITALIIPFTEYGFSTINFWAFLFIFISALIFYVGLMLFVEAMNIGDPIKILPIFYFGIVFTLLYNCIIFKLPVDFYDICGSLIIVIVNVIGSLNIKKDN